MIDKNALLALADEIDPATGTLSCTEAARRLRALAAQAPAADSEAVAFAWAPAGQFDPKFAEQHFMVSRFQITPDSVPLYTRPPAAATVADGVRALDVEAARRERDEAREELEQLRNDYALLANEMIYDGNSIGWIASKATNYGRDLSEAWDAVRAVGGKCDGSTKLADAIRRQLTAAPTPPAVDEAMARRFIAAHENAKADHIPKVWARGQREERDVIVALRAALAKQAAQAGREAASG